MAMEIIQKEMFLRELKAERSISELSDALNSRNSSNNIFRTISKNFINEELNEEEVNFNDI